MGVVKHAYVCVCVRDVGADRCMRADDMMSTSTGARITSQLKLLLHSDLGVSVQGQFLCSFSE